MMLQILLFLPLYIYIYGEKGNKELDERKNILIASDSDGESCLQTMDSAQRCRP